MHVEPLSVEDIQTSDLYYHDERIEKDCYHFCRMRDIDCLPSLDSDWIMFARDDSTRSFQAKEIPDTQKVSASEAIFLPSLLEQFRLHPLLFVYNESHLTGVLHFSDYDRPNVSVYLYALFLDYERALRQLLATRLTNQDMIEFLDPRNDRRKINEFRSREQLARTLPEFQLFYLRDLIRLARRHGIVQLDEDVNQLRNYIMHARELVSMEDFRSDDLIYTFRSFETFFSRVQVLRSDLRRVQNRLRFQRASGSAGQTCEPQE